MFWPFKRERAVPFEEAIAGHPEPACGKKSEHYFYRDIEGMPCPHCSAMRQRHREQAEREALAELIAKKVVKRLQGPGTTMTATTGSTREG